MKLVKVFVTFYVPVSYILDYTLKNKENFINGFSFHVEEEILSTLLK